MYILCLIGLWTRSPKTEVEKLRIERFEVFLNVFAGFVNLGKSEKQRKLWPIFLKKIQVFEKERKKKNYHFASALFSKDMLRVVKGFAPWILFDCFEEKFLYPLECREVPSGS